MKKIENLASLEGRKILQNLFKEMRFIKQRSAMSHFVPLLAYLRKRKGLPGICQTRDTCYAQFGNCSRQYANGMEEIVNRFYFLDN